MLVILQSSIFESSNHSWSSAIENSPIPLSAFFYRDFRYLLINLIHIRLSDRDFGLVFYPVYYIHIFF